MQNSEKYLEPLPTDNPQEGRELATKLARKSIAAIQNDQEVRKNPDQTTLRTQHR